MPIPQCLICGNLSAIPVPRSHSFSEFQDFGFALTTLWKQSRLFLPPDSSRDRFGLLLQSETSPGSKASHFSLDFSTKNDWALSQPDASTGYESVARSWPVKGIENLCGWNCTCLARSVPAK